MLLYLEYSNSSSSILCSSLLIFNLFLSVSVSVSLCLPLPTILLYVFDNILKALFELLKFNSLSAPFNVKTLELELELV